MIILKVGTEFCVFINIKLSTVLEKVCHLKKKLRKLKIKCWGDFIKERKVDHV